MRRWFPWVAAAVVGLIGWQVVKLHLHHDGARAQQIKTMETELALRLKVITALATRKVRVDTVAKGSSRKADHAVSQYDSLVIALAPPIQILGAADAAIKACSLARHNCAAQVAVRDTLIGEQEMVIQGKDSIIGILKKQRPSRLACVVGGAVNQKGFGAGAACGWKL